MNEHNKKYKNELNIHFKMPFNFKNFIRHGYKFALLTFDFSSTHSQEMRTRKNCDK